jgi:hypothetical protein
MRTSATPLEPKDVDESFDPDDERPCRSSDTLLVADMPDIKKRITGSAPTRVMSTRANRISRSSWLSSLTSSTQLPVK